MTRRKHEQERVYVAVPHLLVENVHQSSIYAEHAEGSGSHHQQQTKHQTQMRVSPQRAFPCAFMRPSQERDC